MRVATGLVITVLMLAGCSASEQQDPVGTSSPEETIESEKTEGERNCRPGRPAKISGGIRIPKRCPSSRPEPVGFSERIRLGSVLADLPCKELPDFAGSYWRVAKPHPPGLRMIGHDDIPGRMTLVSRKKALFIGGPIRMSMGNSKRTMRFPTKGQIEVTFERIEGAVAVGGCA